VLGPIRDCLVGKEHLSAAWVSLGDRVPPGFVIARCFSMCIADMGLSSARDTLDSLTAGTQDTTASADKFV